MLLKLLRARTGGASWLAISEFFGKLSVWDELPVERWLPTESVCPCFCQGSTVWQVRPFPALCWAEELS